VPHPKKKAEEVLVENGFGSHEEGFASLLQE
jgi:hypothetical protein